MAFKSDEVEGESDSRHSLEGQTRCHGSMSNTTDSYQQRDARRQTPDAKRQTPKATPCPTAHHIFILGAPSTAAHRYQIHRTSIQRGTPSDPSQRLRSWFDACWVSFKIFNISSLAISTITIVHNRYSSGMKSAIKPNLNGKIGMRSLRSKARAMPMMRRMSWCLIGAKGFGGSVSLFRC